MTTTTTATSTYGRDITINPKSHTTLWIKSHTTTPSTEYLICMPERIKYYEHIKQPDGHRKIVTKKAFVVCDKVSTYEEALAIAQTKNKMIVYTCDAIDSEKQKQTMSEQITYEKYKDIRDRGDLGSLKGYRK